MATYAPPRPLSGAWMRQRWLVDIAAALAVAVIAVGSTWFVDEWGTRRGVGMGLFFLALIWFAATRRTLLALAVFMAYIGMVDGYAKLSTGSTAVSLVRDALLFAIAVGVLVRAQVSGKELRLPPLTGWLIAFVVLVLVQLLNPSNGTLVHSLAGVRQHLEFVPLFFLAFAFVRTKQALLGFVVLLLVIGAANGIASYLQFNLTAQQFAEWGPGYADRVLGRGDFVDAGRTFTSGDTFGNVRPFGLGSDAGAGGVMGAFALGAVLALLTQARQTRYRLFAAVMAFGALAAVITSQGRSAIFCAVIVVFAYGLLTATTRGRLTTLIGIGVTAAVTVVVVQAVLSATAPSSGSDETFRYAGLSTSNIVETTTKARGGSIALIPENIVNYPFGAGLGVAGPATSVAGAGPNAGEIDTETWFSFMVAEAGVPAMVLVTGFTLLLIVLGLTRLRREEDDETRALLAAILAPIVAIFAFYWAGGGLTATTPYAPYLWSVGGIVSYWLIVRPAALRRGATPPP